MVTQSLSPALVCAIPSLAATTSLESLGGVISTDSLVACFPRQEGEPASALIAVHVPVTRQVHATSMFTLVSGRPLATPWLILIGPAVLTLFTSVLLSIILNRLPDVHQRPRPAEDQSKVRNCVIGAADGGSRGIGPAANRPRHAWPAPSSLLRILRRPPGYEGAAGSPCPNVARR